MPHVGDGGEFLDDLVAAAGEVQGLVAGGVVPVGVHVLDGLGRAGIMALGAFAAAVLKARVGL